MKKFTSIFIAVLMVLTMFPSVSFAAGEITIISPASEVNVDLSSFDVECSSAQKIIFKLDGNIVGETAGETSFNIPDGLLTVGSHTLDVVVIYSDGTATSVSKKFDVSAVIEKVSYSDDGSLSGFALQPKNVSAFKETVGVSGQEGDIAKIFYMTQDAAYTSGLPYIENSSVYFGKGGIKKLSFDFKLNDINDGINMEGMDGMMSNNRVIRDGVWQNGSSTPVTTAWTHVEIVSNNYENKLIYKVDGSEIYNSTIKSKSSKGLRFSMAQVGNRTEATRAGLTLDNIVASQTYNYSVSDAQWADSAGTWSDDVSAIPTDVSKIRIKTNDLLNASSVNSDNVFVYDNGKKVKLSEVTYDDQNSYVIAVLDETLSNESNVVLELSENIVLANAGIATGVAAQAHFKTQTAMFAPSNVDYMVNSSALLSTEQLKTGDVVSVNLILNNQSGESKTMAAIVCVFQNQKLRAIGACEETVTSSTKATTITLPPISSLDSEGEVTIKIITCNSLSNPQAYVNYSEMK